MSDISLYHIDWYYEVQLLKKVHKMCLQYQFHKSSKNTPYLILTFTDLWHLHSKILLNKDYLDYIENEPKNRKDNNQKLYKNEIKMKRKTCFRWNTNIQAGEHRFPRLGSRTRKTARRKTTWQAIIWSSRPLMFGDCREKSKSPFALARRRSSTVSYFYNEGDYFIF